MNDQITDYNVKQTEHNRIICDGLATEMTKNLPGFENKVWHGAPVWFIDGNPIVGYAVRKTNVQLLFWSGQSFDEPDLTPEGKFKAAEVLYTSVDQINSEDIERWVAKSVEIQWDYKNIVKKRGQLDRLK